MNDWKVASVSSRASTTCEGSMWEKAETWWTTDDKSSLGSTCKCRMSLCKRYCDLHFTLYINPIHDGSGNTYHDGSGKTSHDESGNKSHDGSRNTSHDGSGNTNQHESRKTSHDESGHTSYDGTGNKNHDGRRNTSHDEMETQINTRADR